MASLEWDPRPNAPDCSWAVDGQGGECWTERSKSGWWSRAELETPLGLASLRPWTLYATEPEAREAAERLLAELRRRFRDA